MHTKDKLAKALMEIGLIDMSLKARGGYYHDFLSPLDMPEIQLVNDLAGVGTPAAMALRQRVINGEFDATKEESDDWAASEAGQAAFANLLGATGDHPRGKLNKNDQGGLRLAVTHDNKGHVHVNFGKPVKWFALPTDQAIQFATLIAKHAGAKTITIEV